MLFCYTVPYNKFSSLTYIHTSIREIGMAFSQQQIKTTPVFAWHISVQKTVMLLLYFVHRHSSSYLPACHHTISMLMQSGCFLHFVCYLRDTNALSDDLPFFPCQTHISSKGESQASNIVSQRSGDSFVQNMVNYFFMECPALPESPALVT